MGNGVAAALVVAAVGGFVPACLWSGSDAEFGKICAEADGGEAECVPAEEGPAEAWSRAKAHGSLPIQMWVEQPDSMSLDQLVTSQANMNTWFETIDSVLKYVRGTEGDAESYRATLGGKLGEIIKHAKAQQKMLASGGGVNASGHFKQALIDKANAEKDPLVATIADDKQSMDAVDAALSETKKALLPLGAEFTKLADDFAAYRATEVAESDAYTTLAADASKAELGGLSAIEASILAAAMDASAKPNALMMSAMKLSGEIQQLELSSQEAIEPHADFMMTHGAAIPDMTSGAQRSINAMLGYMERRVARCDATATSLLLGVGMRRKALQMLAASPVVKTQTAEAKIAKASLVFLDAATSRVAAVKSAPEVSAKLGLPYLAKRYDELLRVVQMAPFCGTASTSWRDAGCSALRDNVKEASSYLKTTLPSLLVTGLTTMKAKGAPAEIVDAAKTKLDAGDIKAAAVLHDAALRAVERT